MKKFLIKIWCSFNLIFGMSLLHKIITTLLNSNSIKDYAVKICVGTFVLYFVLDYIKKFFKEE